MTTDLHDDARRSVNGSRRTMGVIVTSIAAAVLGAGAASGPAAATNSAVAGPAAGSAAVERSVHASGDWTYYGLYVNRTECIKAAKRLVAQYPNLGGYECRGFD